VPENQVRHQRWLLAFDLDPDLHRLPPLPGRFSVSAVSVKMPRMRWPDRTRAGTASG
jgi:hypothetical protein